VQLQQGPKQSALRQPVLRLLVQLQQGPKQSVLQLLELEPQPQELLPGLALQQERQVQLRQNLSHRQ
jgi:hypothetical protein